MESKLILADLFQDHMMFQYKQPMVFFGEAKKCGNLEISVFDHTSLFLLEEGRFCVKIDHPSHTFDSFIVTLKFDEETVTLRDCLFGDIFFVSGQSNAQMTIKETSFHEPVANPLIRFYEVPKLPYANAHKEFPYFYSYHPKWMECTPETAMEFSAIGYHIASMLHQGVNHPIGIISCNMGDTSVFSWLDEQTIRHDERLAEYAKSYDLQLANYASLQAYEEAYHTKLPELMSFYGEIDSNIKAGKPSEEAHNLAYKKYPNPYIPMGPKHYNRPGGCYEMTTQEVIPFSIKGVVYYQGESDHQNVHLYQHALQTLFDRYRIEFNNPELPIFFIQIANYVYPGVAKDAIARIRQAQQNLCNPKQHQYLISAIDLGEPNNIHPREKTTLSKRIALAIETYVYGRSYQALSPMMQSYQWDHDMITMEASMNSEPLYLRSHTGVGFEYSLDNEVFYPIESISVIERKVTLYVPEGTQVVRYAYKESPICDLYSKNELPCLPFEIRQ